MKNQYLSRGSGGPGQGCSDSSKNTQPQFVWARKGGSNISLIWAHRNCFQNGPKTTPTCKTTATATSTTTTTTTTGNNNNNNPQPTTNQPLTINNYNDKKKKNNNNNSNNNNSNNKNKNKAKSLNQRDVGPRP